MSTYNIPQEVRDSFAPTGEGEQPKGTTDDPAAGGDDDSTKGTTGDTKTNSADSGASKGDEGEGNGPSKGDSEGKDKEPTKQQEPASVKLDGKEYGLEDLGRIVKEHQENKDWKKSNTEKSQTLSAQVKAIEGVTDVLEKLLKDEDALEILEDMGHKLDKEALSAVKKTAKEAQTNPDREEKPETSDEMKQLRTEMNDMKFMEALRELTAQDEDHQKALGPSEKRQAFLKFMVENNLSDLDKAYDLYTQAERLKETEAALEEAKKKGGKSKPKAPVGPGARDFKSGFKPVQRDFGYDAARKATLESFNK